MRIIKPFLSQLVAALFLAACAASPPSPSPTRSFRSRTIGFLLPSCLTLVVAELLSGLVRPYFAPAMWLQHSLGVSEYLLLLAMALAAYDAIQIGRVHAEPRLQPAQEAT